VFCLPDLYRLGPAAIRDKATAAKVVGLLADHGYVEAFAGGAEGRWRREVWRRGLKNEAVHPAKAAKVSGSF
jgi:hypothetical protein